ncbi:hypothetical protein HDV00_003201 [Rhizophlyctis rosea]|nr:hypothetical protein HDV00_003201 [Rhizophlyctis rosea]
MRYNVEALQAAPAPALPGQDQPFQGPIAIVAKGGGGLADMKKTMSTTTLWAVLRDNGRILFVHQVPDHIPKPHLKTIQGVGKAIASVIHHHSQITIGSPSELTDAAIHANLHGTGTVNSRKTSQTSLAPSTRESKQSESQGSLSLGARTLSGDVISTVAADSEADLLEDQERAARYSELRNKLKAESDARVEAAKARKAEEVKWHLDSQQRERRAIDEQKGILRKSDDDVTPTVRGPVKSQALLSRWINVQTPDGRLWRRRLAVVKGPKLLLFKDELAKDPVETIDLSGSQWRNVTPQVFLPNSFGVKPKIGGTSERIFNADDKAHYYQTLAAIELKS